MPDKTYNVFEYVILDSSLKSEKRPTILDRGMLVAENMAGAMVKASMSFKAANPDTPVEDPTILVRRFDQNVGC